MFENHKCKIPWKSTKEIEVSSYYDCSTEDEQHIVGVGLDGIRYWFTVKRREAIPYLSDESKQDEDSDEDVTAP